MNHEKQQQKVIIVGGGIGGLAAALALTRQGIRVQLLEQAEQIGEIGAGIQLGPNAYAALDALGAGEAARRRSVFTDHIIMMDAVDAGEVVRIDVGAAFQQRFGNPYGVIHRADIHLSILEAVEQDPLISFQTSTRITSMDLQGPGVTLIDQHGQRYQADAVLGCDGVKSVVREQLLGDTSRVTGHVVYRAVVDEQEMPEELRVNAPVLWAGPRCHLVHYPLRGGQQYNLVVTFHSREQEEWGVRDGSKAEVLSYFQGIHPSPARLLETPSSWRRWATADREPVARWGQGNATLLGDAAHPMSQYLAQGACMALEDAVTLGEAVRACGHDLQAAFRLYESVRIPRTARVVWSTREMGRLYHAQGVERSVRNSLWEGRSQAQFYDAVQWLYGWNVDNCLGAGVNGGRRSPLFKPLPEPRR
ncbi:3-hydroxybenzoate 6-monooxygenase [Pseudomonas chlororaphis]|uniref:3-hydroxybenzoate 6-hydroxylase n=1 Tax=Pseudomonas chlororaphis TaxID=587753 RepID=A0AAX3FT29_9PSED|nr:3-hydroxybenzoate 6-monooxygenase [Pseudomonas chlororaphis]AZC37975.1 Putative n-hydroxybenzoate hydroxylase [Pseudomonas chlororaphis subsp. piscium]AZC44522.1 Putative n-hydroxybenzoate hydroxylase [Pseudomonas chlororaphis subsp. piscium]WDG70151.1 3-hydroxybenzoate 6-monooxygenase [Pseudomonas chlororaphis]WDH32064.1 3-hydroxybenzoate 6-monooxygenase [Pseudomonas chlororaphis]WDH68676.1 3-hydroxybenzoate 6-monooxygenase [Pseudomonas chlororaphis]